MQQRLLPTFFLILYSGICLHAQTTAIPDTGFEQELIDQGIDSNGLNGNILNSDALGVSSLTISANTITDFTGLEAFTVLEYLDAGTNQFATLPLLNLTALKTLIFDQNQVLENLDLSSNTELTTLDIRANGL